MKYIDFSIILYKNGSNFWRTQLNTKREHLKNDIHYKNVLPSSFIGTKKELEEYKEEQEKKGFCVYICENLKEIEIWNFISIETL